MNGREAMELQRDRAPIALIPVDDDTPAGAIIQHPAGTRPVPIQMPQTLSREQLDLLKRTIAKGTTDDEFALWLEKCKRCRVDPFSKLIYPVKRWDSKEQREVMALQSSIDHFRLTADRSGRYAGQLGPFWCGPDGVWVDVWLKPEPPAAAKVGVLCRDFKEPLWTVALWSNYVQKGRDGKPMKNWASMGPLMIAKCAEALGIRRAFPEDLAGLYTSEEMDQAVHDAPAIAPPKPAGTLTERVQAREAPRAVAAAVVQPAGSQEVLAPLPPKGDPQASAPVGAEVSVWEVREVSDNPALYGEIRAFQFDLPPIDEWFEQEIGGRKAELKSRRWSELFGGDPALVAACRPQVAKSWQKVQAGGQLTEPEKMLLRCLSEVDFPATDAFDWGSGSTDGAKAVTT